MTRAKSIAGLVGCFVITFVAAAVGSVASIRAADFYQELSRPAWAPPAGVFGPVWSILYCLMAVASWLIWSGGQQGRGAALGAYVFQLGLNALWSWVFFVWRDGFWAVVEVLILWGAIVMTTALFWRVRTTAALLLVPYLIWVTFAVALTVAVWRLNPRLLF